MFVHHERLDSNFAHTLLQFYSACALSDPWSGPLCYYCTLL